MADIAVVGMGQGGMVCAIKLAKAGHNVTVFEKQSKREVGYDWKDDIRSDIFGITGIEMPNESIYCQKSKWLFVSPNEKFSLPVPPCPPMEEISISRRGLSAHFASLAAQAGCKVLYDAEICDLIVENEVVKGVRAGDDNILFDLVIDASGMRSGLRAQIPQKFLIQKQPFDDDVLYGYRAFFTRNPDGNTTEKGIDCTLVLKHLGEEGISWCNLNDEGEVDVLIGRVGQLDDESICRALSELKRKYPVLGDELLREKRVEICLRNSIATPVADGYVAIGDSAFMTMPLMGSGIESSMKAGKLFSDHIIDNDINDFTAKNMWGFYHRYMTELGADFSAIDVLKRWALSRDPQIIDWVFGSGLIQKQDLALISTDNSENKPKISAKSILKKLFLLLGHLGFVCSALKCVSKSVKAKRVSLKIPAVYDEKKLAKWTKKYNAITHKKKQA